MFATVNYFHTSQVLKNKSGAYQSKVPLLKGRRLAMPLNIRLGWNRVTVANTLAYYDTKLMSAVERFIDP